MQTIRECKYTNSRDDKFVHPTQTCQPASEVQKYNIDTHKVSWGNQQKCYHSSISVCPSENPLRTSQMQEREPTSDSWWYHPQGHCVKCKRFTPRLPFSCTSLGSSVHWRTCISLVQNKNEILDHFQWLWSRNFHWLGQDSIWRWVVARHSGCRVHGPSSHCWCWTLHIYNWNVEIFPFFLATKTYFKPSISRLPFLQCNKTTDVS